MNLPSRFGAESEVPEFPFVKGDKITAVWLTEGSFIKVLNVGDYSFVGEIHGSTDWKEDGTQVVFGFNQQWERYPLTSTRESGTLKS